MPTKKRAATDKRKLPQKQFNGYVDQRLDDIAKKAIKQRLDNIDVLKIVEGLAGNGFRPAVKWDWDSECWRLDVYRCFQGYQDSGYTYTARHTDLATCFAIADYVINERWDGVYPVGDDVSW